MNLKSFSVIKFLDGEFGLYTLINVLQMNYNIFWLSFLILSMIEILLTAEDFIEYLL